MVIKPMIRSNMCLNAHPVGCARNTERQIEYVKAQKAKRGIQATDLQAVFLRRLSTVLIQSAFLLKKHLRKQKAERRAGTTMLRLTALQRKKVLLQKHSAQTHSATKPEK